MNKVSQRNEVEIKKIEESLLKITYPICKFGQAHFQENATQICLDDRCPTNIRFEAICNSCTSKRGEHFKDSHKHANLGAITQDIIDQIKTMLFPEEETLEAVESSHKEGETKAAGKGKEEEEKKNKKSDVSGIKLIQTLVEQENAWLNMAELCQEVARKIHISKENYMQSKYATVPTECLQILSCISNLTKVTTLDNINQQFRELQRYTKTQDPSSAKDTITLKIEDSSSRKIFDAIQQQAEEKLKNSQQILSEFQKRVEELASQPEVQGYQQIKYQEYYLENARAFADKCIHINSSENVSQIQPQHELIIVKSLQSEVVSALKQINLSNRLVDIEMEQESQSQNCKKIVELLDSDSHHSLQNLVGINLIIPQMNLREISSTNDSSNELLFSIIKPLQSIIEKNKIKDFGLNLKNWSKCTSKSAQAISDTIKYLSPSAPTLISFSLNLQSIFHFGGESFIALTDSLKQLAQQASRLQNFSLNTSRLVNLSNLEIKSVLDFVEQVVFNNQNIHLFDLNLALLQNLSDDNYKQVGDIFKILAANNKTISTLKINFMGWQGISDKNAQQILENLENLVMSNNLFKCFTLDISNWENCTDLSVNKMDDILKTLVSFCKTLEEFNLNMSYWKLGTPKSATQLTQTLVKLAKSSSRIYKFNLNFFNWSDASVEIFEQLQQDLQNFFNSNAD